MPRTFESVSLALADMPWVSVDEAAGDFDLLASVAAADLRPSAARSTA
ncbi:hypothetical protein [Streptomyces sp. NPDC060035]